MLSFSQTIHIESNQSVAFKTQLGEMYGQNTRCKVFFKVSRVFSAFSKTLVCPIAENLCLSIPGSVLPSIRCFPPTGKLQRQTQQRRFPLPRRSKVAKATLTVTVELGHTCLSRFCQNTGPSNFTSRANKLVLRFRTTRRDHGHDHDNDNDHDHDQGHGHGEGAECTIACSDFTPRPRPDPVTCNPEGSVLNSKKSQR